MQKFKNYLKNSRAATAIEFAIIAPVFFLLLLGIIEFGFTMFFDSSLSSGLRAAAREGIPKGFTAPSEVETILNRHLGGLYDNSKATLVVRTYDNFDSAAFTAARTSFQSAGGAAAFFSTAAFPVGSQSGKVVLYGVRYQWGGVFGTSFPFVPDYLYIFSIVRNEEY